jgi:magnesium-transporting ATPase (P-type)
VCLGRLCDLKKINGKNYTTMQTLDGESNATKKFIEKILNYHHRCSFLTLSFLHYL